MLTSSQLVDEYFIENRTRILEIAAFLDRLHRTGGKIDDFRLQAFEEALKILADGSGSHLARIQELLSDPTTEPKADLDRKSAIGAHNHWKSAR